MRDFTIHSNTNGLGLRSNAIKDLCPLILHQLVVGWIGKAHCPTRVFRSSIFAVEHSNRQISQRTTKHQKNHLETASHVPHTLPKEATTNLTLSNMHVCWKTL